MSGEHGAAQGGPPHCYRHPDRETYISCQRCGRPICPDCMHPASVGYQCPECVREGSRNVRAPRTAAGGLLPRQAGAVTWTLIGINVVVFLVTLATGGTHGEPFRWGAMLSVSAFDPQNGGLLTGVAEGGYWRLLTSAFLHENLLHILFNMYALYIFGPMLERYLGVGRFIAMYLTVALGGSVFVYLLSPERSLTIGASGAIFGLFAVALVLLIRQRQNVTFLLVLLAINAVLSLQGGISWQGHLGGFVTGGVLGLAFAYAPRRWRTTAQYAAFGLLWIGIVAGVVLRTAQLTV
ncbi:MAG: rhomboid family intramembrane serine protease [Nocardioidaceae bacterium]